MFECRICIQGKLAINTRGWITTGIMKYRIGSVLYEVNFNTQYERCKPYTLKHFDLSCHSCMMIILNACKATEITTIFVDNVECNTGISLILYSAWNSDRKLDIFWPNLVFVPTCSSLVRHHYVVKKINKIIKNLCTSIFAQVSD